MDNPKPIKELPALNVTASFQRLIRYFLDEEAYYKKQGRKTPATSAKKAAAIVQKAQALCYEEGWE